MQNPRDLLVAWLHDPPDKALGIRGHEARAARYLTAALGDDIAPEEIRGHAGDQRASATERLPVPDWNSRHSASGVSGPIINSNGTPSEWQPGMEVELKVQSANDREISFRYQPKE